MSDLTEIREALTPEIRKQLAVLAYNRGITGVRRLLVGYIESRRQMRQTINELDLDLNKNLSQVQKILNFEPDKRKLLKKAKIKKLSFAEYAVIHGVTYLSNRSAAQDYVRRHLGKSCGDF
jgi:hypothetical protein